MNASAADGRSVFSGLGSEHGLDFTSKHHSAKRKSGPLSARTFIPPLPSKTAGQHGRVPRPGDPAHPSGERRHTGQDSLSRQQSEHALKFRKEARFCALRSGLFENTLLLFFLVQAVDFLSQVLDSPESQAIKAAVKNLMDIGKRFHFW